MRFLVVFVVIFGVQDAWGQAAISITPEFSSAVNKTVVFTAKRALVLHCNASGDGVTAENAAVEWQKEGVDVTEISNMKNRIKRDQTGLRFTLTVDSADAADVGNYSCRLKIGGEEKAFSDINVVTSIFVRIKSENINVVEEEKLRIECNVLGSPFPTLSWTIETSNYNGSTFDERVVIQNYSDDDGRTVENGVLVISKANKEDRGLYRCLGKNQFWDKDFQEATTMVRVRDKYAALWPFLGICAEVIILCAVIIIYEKKRNKTELEESDTDQSPDQKNTPDHGKDANLRHRQ